MPWGSSVSTWRNWAAASVLVLHPEEDEADVDAHLGVGVRRGLEDAHQAGERVPGLVLVERQHRDRDPRRHVARVERRSAACAAAIAAAAVAVLERRRQRQPAPGLVGLRLRARPEVGDRRSGRARGREPRRVAGRLVQVQQVVGVRAVVAVRVELLHTLERRLRPPSRRRPRAAPARAPSPPPARPAAAPGARRSTPPGGSRRRARMIAATLPADVVRRQPPERRRLRRR